MTRWALAALFGISLSGCVTTSVSIESRATAQRLTDDSERYIVAAVDNENLIPAVHAGSTPRGYDGVTVYGPTSRARQRMQALENEYGLREITAWPIAPLHMHCAVLEIPSSGNRARVLAALSNDRRIRLAQPLQTFETRTENYDDPYVGLQRGFQQMHVPAAHEWSRGDGVRIAIVDTGADTEHPDLRGAIVQAANFVDSDARQFREDRHGTELAGVIAAVANNREGIVGVAPGARLLVFKACWQLQEGADAARCNSFTLAKALAAALDAHAQIVNLSLSGPQDPLLAELISEGLRRGILFIGAASSNAANGIDRLLRQTGVIEVASGGTQGYIGTPLYAPGTEILTLLPGAHYDFASGSSLATAHVTGTAALLLAANPNLTAAAVYQLLRDTAPITSGLRAEDGVDACAAVVAVVGHGSCEHLPAQSRVAGGGSGHSAVQ
ncbi:MAG TPA: S8 family serine peptidase [Steroidobacteraceae bacterium]|nr:S8 family serine peptidase [Steroidobacteraceae bacterium]